MTIQESIIITCLANQLDKRGVTNIEILDGAFMECPTYQIKFEYDNSLCCYSVFKSYVKRYGAFITIKNIFKELKLK